MIVKTLETHAQGRDALVDALDGRARSGSRRSAVLRIWRAFGLQPHRQETWKLSKDPQFVDKVRDVVGLYLNPPERAVVLCVDEKSQIQALDRTAPILPMLPGMPERATHDYKRHGTSSLYAALDLTHRQGDRRAAQPPPRDRVQAVPADARPRGPRRPRRPPRARQLLHAQDAGDPALAGRAPPLRACTSPRPVELVAEPRRALVRRADHQEAHAAARTAPSAPSTPTSAPGSRPGTTTPSPSSGPRPPTRSSTPSPATANESTNHDTRPPAMHRPASAQAIRPGHRRRDLHAVPLQLKPARSSTSSRGRSKLAVDGCRRRGRRATSSHRTLPVLGGSDPPRAHDSALPRARRRHNRLFGQSLP